MPTYNYECPECKEIEVFHSIKEELKECPICKEKGIFSEVKRLISKGSNFILSGSGWAKDKYS